MVNRGVAAITTIAFLSVVRPDPDASKIGIAFTGILMYEALAWCIGYIQKHRKDKYFTASVNETVDPGDIVRWWNTRINWPMHEEVS